MALKIANYGVMDRQQSPREAWLCFAALFILATASAFNLFKASACLTFIGADLGIGESDLGLIMTSYTIAALILAYPGMAIMRILGVKFTSIATAILMLIGTIISTFSTDAVAFLFGRIVEGCAYGFLMVIGPNIMVKLFPPKKQGLVMGAWSLWIPVGVITSFFLAPLIFDAFGWRTIWYVSIAFEIIAVIAGFLFIKMPKINENEMVEGDTTKKRSYGKSLIIGGIALNVAFCIWVYIYVVNINGFYPTFLQQAKDLSVFDSSMMPNIIAILTIVTSLAFGVLADKLAARKWFLAGAFLLTAVLMFFFAFSPGTDMTGPWVFCLLMALCCGCVPMGTRALIPLLTPEPKMTEWMLTTMAFGQSVASLLSVLASFAIFGSGLGWTGSSQFILAPLALLAAIIIIVFVKSDRQILQFRQSEQSGK